MNCFHTVYRTEFFTAIVSTVGRALAAEHTVGALLCLVHHYPTLPVHLTNMVPIHNDVCIVITCEKFDG